MSSRRIILNLGIAAALWASAASHAYLYLHGYRYLPAIGFGFLASASAFGALGILIAANGPAWLRVAASVLSAGALAAFGMSRTTGLLGFVEHGLQPAPHALISLVAEAAALALGALSLRGAIRASSRP